MTIRGFRSLLERDKEIYSKKIGLKDTNLIVDGDNFIIELLSKLDDDQTSINYRTKFYSSDMVSYAKAFREVCEKLKKCKIYPIFVFSGTMPNQEIVQHPQDPIRIDNQLRSKKCLEDVNKDFEKDNKAGRSTCCILLKATSKTLIEDMGFERRRTPFLCDKYICNLSIEKKCPIVSSDSDYILMESHEGFIMNGEIYDGNPVEITNEAGEITGYCLECFIYSRDNLLSQYPGLKKEVIPLFGAMMDSSYLKSMVTEQLLASFKVVKPGLAGDQVDNPDSKDYSPNQQRIINIFKFLSKSEDPQSALRSIINTIDRRTLRGLRPSDLYGLINSRMKIWSIEDTSMIDAKRNLKRLYPDNGEELHKFILDDINNDNISSKFTNIIFKTTQFERFYIEMRGWHSSNVLKKRIYSIALALTRAKSITKMSEEEKKVVGKRDVCKIYDRIGNELVFLCTVPLSHLHGDINLDDFDIEKFVGLKSDEAISIVLGAFYSTKEDWILLNELTDLIFKDTFSYNAAICLLMFKYVAIESKMNVKNLVDAVLLTMVYYAISNDELIMSKENLDHKEDLLSNLNGLLDQVEDPVARNKFPKEFYETTHMIAMFNVALWGFINLNSIVKNPMGTLRPELFMNGRMIYMFYRLTSSILTQGTCIIAYPEFLRDNIKSIREKLSEFIPIVKRKVIAPLVSRDRNSNAPPADTASASPTPVPN